MNVRTGIATTNNSFTIFSSLRFCSHWQVVGVIYTTRL